MVPYGTIWYHMIPYGTIWYPLLIYVVIYAERRFRDLLLGHSLTDFVEFNELARGGVNVTQTYCVKVRWQLQGGA